MTVQELYDVLSKYVADGKGDVKVAIEADHSQVAMHVSWVGLGDVETTDEYMMELLDDENEDDGEEILVIQAY